MVCLHKLAKHVRHNHRSMRPLLQPTFAHLVCLSGQKKRVYVQTHLFIFIKIAINTYLFTFNTYTHCIFCLALQFDIRKLEHTQALI
jgi:hypothetical protein